MLGKVVDGFYFDPTTGTVVKDVDKDRSALFPPGVSAIDGGHLLPFTAKQAAEEINEIEDQQDSSYEGEES